MENILGVLGIGFLLGIKHAIEPDHVIAVSTIAGRHKSFWQSGFLGVFWGIGHTLALLLVFLILTLTKGSIPIKWEMAFELGVGIMLVYLGFASFRKPVQITAKTEIFPHQHLYLKSMFIGQIHGLAGSAAMTLLALSMVDSLQEAVLYIGTFGTGTIIGMLLFTMLMSIPFFYTGKIRKADRLLTGTASVISIFYGIYYIYTIGFQEGLFY
jgi:hypothetical protein